MAMNRNLEICQCKNTTEKKTKHKKTEQVSVLLMWCHHVSRSGINDLPVFWPQGFAVPARIVFAQILYLCKTPEWLRALGL